MSYVYILTNVAMPGMVKIGKTNTSVEQRMQELNRHSGVPLPFTCYYAARVADSDKVERKLHEAFGDSRVRPQREFFYLSPNRAQAALELAALEDVTPRQEIIDDNPKEAEAAIERSTRAHRNLPSFQEYGIPIGATLSFTKDASISAVVDGPRTINFQGKSMSMTAAALEALKTLGYSWKSVQGPAYWEYEGQSIWDYFEANKESEE